MTTGPVEPEVVRVLRDYRRALDAQEASLMRDMARRWVEVERSLEADISLLAREMAERQATGEIVTEQMIWREQRYKYLKAQMEAEIARFNGDAVGIISASQQQTATLGIRAAQTAIQIQLGPFGRAWNRLNINAIEAMIGFAGDGSPLSRLLKADYPDALGGMLSALINGVSRGFNSSQVALDMMNGVSIGFNRALLIARTEIARAYRVGSVKQYRDSGVTKGFMRLVKKETACLACLMLDGQKFVLADELTDHPGGKCIVLAQIEGVPLPQWQHGLTYFRNLSPEEQETRMGPEKYQLWKEGAFKLEELAKFSHSATWGDAPRVATVQELAP